MRLLLIGSALVALAAAPALAEPEVSVESVQSAVEVYFGQTNQVTLANWRGQGSGPGDWGMQRRVTGAKTTQRCITVLQTPQVLFQGGQGAANPSKTYGIDWAKLSDIQRDGKIIVFRAAHMASDEFGEFDFPAEDEAEMFEAVMSYLADACRK